MSILSLNLALDVLYNICSEKFLLTEERSSMGNAWQLQLCKRLQEVFKTLALTGGLDQCLQPIQFIIAERKLRHIHDMPGM